MLADIKKNQAESGGAMVAMTRTGMAVRTERTNPTVVMMARRRSKMPLRLNNSTFAETVLVVY
jgi:hypothetical protein